MLKKLIPLMISVAALLALAAPAAHATGALITTNEGGTATTFSAVSGNSAWTTANGTFECATVKLNGSIATNANTTAEGSGSGTANGTMTVEPQTDHCATDSGATTHWTNVTIDRLHLHRVQGETSGTLDITFTYQITTIFGTSHCGFASGEDEAGNSEVAVNRTSAATINVNGRLIKPSGGFLCPSEGTFNGDFSVRAHNGELAIIH